jgi:inorganic triphosphatase YgiF
MEIEAKYRVTDPAIFSDLLAQTTCDQYALVPRSAPEQQHNTYLDTHDRRLSAQNWGLRIRDYGERRVATLKGRATMSDGVAYRIELETPVGNEIQPTAWPPSALRDRVLALIDDAILEPILTIITQRHVIDVFSTDQRFAEICLDQGRFQLVQRVVPFCELEVELTTNEALTDFAALCDLIKQRYQLEVEEQSKLARGLALAAGE